MPAELRYVDPYRPAGKFARAFAALAVVWMPYVGTMVLLILWLMWGYRVGSLMLRSAGRLPTAPASQAALGSPAPVARPARP